MADTMKANTLSTPLYEILGFNEWRLTHSNRQMWTGKRNIRLSIDSQSKQSRVTYQEPECSTIHELSVDATDCDVLGTGKVGALESWMHETEYGIEDDGGEIRADWRVRWVLLYVAAAGEDNGSLDVLASREKNAEDTIASVRSFINSKGLHINGFENMVALPIDDGRREADKKAMEAYEKSLSRSSPETGIWRAEDDIVEDTNVGGVQDDYSRKCDVM